MSSDKEKDVSMQAEEPGGAPPQGGLEDGPKEEGPIGGYGPDRSPATDMPRIPTAPETHDDPRSHDAVPDDGEEQDPHG